MTHSHTIGSFAKRNRRAVLVLAMAAMTLTTTVGAQAANAAGSAIAIDDSLATDFGNPLEISTSSLAANDQNVGGLYVSITTRPAHGRLSISTAPGPMRYTYSPQDPTFRGGVDSFEYCLAALPGDVCLSNAATVTIAVAPAIAQDDYYATPEGIPLEVMAPGVLANDSSHSLLFWAGTSNPAHGVVTPGNAGEFTYTPDTTFVGSDAFTYCLTIFPDIACASDPATVRIRVGGPSASRIGGADRFEVAAGVAEQTHPAGASTVFIASGGNYPDALSAAPAANHAGGALLLTTADAIPAPTQAALTRLAPSKVVIVGGPNTISEGVAAGLKALVPGATVSRIGGADRFAVSRAVATTVFGTAAQAIVATGANYPDALSSGGAAAVVDEPVVLVNGGLGAADAETLSVFGRLGTTTLVISGGPNSVSTGVEASLRTVATVTRVGGADRFEASVNINKASFGTATTAYLATGLNYPDALVGGVISGKNRSPLYVVQTNCVPQATLDDIARIGATKVVLLGGPNSLSDRVFNLVPCA
ncbi:cell wall-binding repeat-containing protein [Herbiconiux sp. YIM B11900]|uniref:cell wall-binding repeat-containing protein n=1 Tax=Herbiconiux sp. YIM B11900 TaxID=3404131 RepID=UPI003F82F001